MRRSLESKLKFASFGLVLVLGGCPAPVVTPENDAGTTPDTSVTDSSTPVDMGRDAAAPDAAVTPLCTGTGCEYVEVALQGATTCARRENGQVDCWGRAQNGELGDDNMHHSGSCPVEGGAPVDCADTASTVLLPGPATRLFAEGVTSICAQVGATGELWCWGTLDWQMGTTLEHDRFEPERFAIAGVGIADGRDTYSASFGHACWVEADATASCIGFGGSGRLGQGTFADATEVVTVQDAAGTADLAGVVGIVAGPGHTCAWTADTLYCWGSNEDGQLGSPAPHTTCGAPPRIYDCAPLPTAVPGIDAAHIVSMDLGWEHSCAMMDDGTLYCWGGARSGSLGTGTMVSSPVPTEPLGVTGVTDLEVGGGTTCALLGTGRVMCWGSANVGQIGDGNETHDSAMCVDGSGAFFDCELTPTEVVGITDAVALEVGISHSCVLTGTAEIWCWGNSDRFQLGNLSRTPVFAPVRAVAAD